MIEASVIPVSIILGMAVLTYVTKAGGLWVLEQVELSDRAKSGLEALPGGIIIAILAPELLQGGPPEWAAAAVVLVVVRRTDSILLSIGTGIFTVLVLRRAVVVL